MPRIPDHKDHPISIDIIEYVAADNLRLASVACIAVTKKGQFVLLFHVQIVYRKVVVNVNVHVPTAKVNPVQMVGTI